jgi:uncharacterized protein YlzI (FlbEa/FlbD family)
MITLTHNNGHKISVNPNHIVFIDDHEAHYDDKCKSAILLVTGTKIFVIESRIEILEKNKITLNG